MSQLLVSSNILKLWLIKGKVNYFNDEYHTTCFLVTKTSDIEHVFQGRSFFTRIEKAVHMSPSEGWGITSIRFRWRLGMYTYASMSDRVGYKHTFYRFILTPTCSWRCTLTKGCVWCLITQPRSVEMVNLISW